AVVVARRDGRPRAAVVACAALFGLAWTLWFTGPLAAREIHERSLRRHARALVAAAGGREILLYGDGLEGGMRGAQGLYAAPAAQMDDAADLVARLRVEPRAVALVRSRDPDRVPPELGDAAAARGVELRPVGRVPFAKDEYFTLFEAAGPAIAK